MLHEHHLHTNIKCYGALFLLVEMNAAEFIESDVEMSHANWLPCEWLEGSARAHNIHIKVAIDIAFVRDSNFGLV